MLLRVDGRLYTEEAIFRTCYVFTDRCYLFLDREGADHITVRFRRRQIEADLDRVMSEFANELVNQRVRIGLAHETKELRRLIVAKAFSGIDEQ